MESPAAVLRKAKLKKLIDRSNRVTVSTDVGKKIIHAGKQLIKEFEDEEVVDEKEITEILQSYLPAPENLFIDELFDNPLFPVVWLKDVASTLIDGIERDEDFSGIPLQDEERITNNMTALTWICRMVEGLKETKKGVYFRYKRSLSIAIRKNNSFVPKVPTRPPMMTVSLQHTIWISLLHVWLPQELQYHLLRTILLR